jgi:hypothetical protein
MTTMTIKKFVSILKAPFDLTSLRLFFYFTTLLYGCKRDQIKVIVPDGYFGEVCLIKSTKNADQFNLDSNGMAM